MNVLSSIKRLFAPKTNVNNTFLRQTFDNMLEGIQIHDFDWKYIYVNKALIGYSQYSKEELLGYKLTDKYPGIENTDLFKVLERCMKERVSEHFETEFIFPNGSKADFELSIQPVPEGLFILSINISDRKKAEREIILLNENLEKNVLERTIELEKTITELKESEEKFQTVFNSEAVGISITHFPDLTFMDLNNTFVQMTGYSKEEVIGRRASDFKMSTNMAKREEVLKEIEEKGYARNFEMTMQHKSGREFIILGSIETVFIKGQRYALNIIYDITDRKKAEEQLAMVNKELEAFSYSISHDLRAPLRAINGYAKMLQEDYGYQIDEEGNRLMQTIVHNAVKMGTLIDDLLAFSRLGKKELKKENVDLNLMLSEVIKDLSRTLNHKATIKFGKLNNVKADYALLYQVMFNLISNGIKYSSKKEHPEIQISSEEKNEEVIVSIKDNGAGFEMKYASKLFGVFQRLHSEEEFEGTGVGLAIVQRVIAKHNGKIRAEGKVNEGATFYFSLPNK